jgi:hypothetical protein
MNPKLSKQTREIAENYENEHEFAVVDAIGREAKLHDGLHWLAVNELANELWSAMMDCKEVEGGSAIDELMAAVVLLSYDQALKRAAKVLDIPVEVLQEMESELSEKEGV